MSATEGLSVRTSVVIAGAIVMIVGVVVFAFGAVGVGQATTDFINCLNSFPTQPIFGYPTACVTAMNAVATWELVEALGGFLGVVGVVVLVVGALLDRERPAPVYAPMYPQPGYAPPPVYAPPQGPPNPPPP